MDSQQIDWLNLAQVLLNGAAFLIEAVVLAFLLWTLVLVLSKAAVNLKGKFIKPPKCPKNHRTQYLGEVPVNNMVNFELFGCSTCRKVYDSPHVGSYKFQIPESTPYSDWPANT